MVWRYALTGRGGAGLPHGAGLAGPAPARGGPFATEMSGLPGRFTAGDQVRTISAVVSQKVGAAGA